MTNSRELIKKVISGDTHAFKSLIHDYQRLVCHVIFKMVTNEQDREDVCQDVFIKVYQKPVKVSIRLEVVHLDCKNRI